MAASDHLNSRQFPSEYNEHYRKGWSAGTRNASTGRMTGSLETTGQDAKAAWHDGYMDQATGRDKYETALYRHNPEKYKGHYGADNPFGD